MCVGEGECGVGSVSVCAPNVYLKTLDLKKDVYSKKSYAKLLAFGLKKDLILYEAHQ